MRWCRSTRASAATGGGPTCTWRAWTSRSWPPAPSERFSPTWRQRWWRRRACRSGGAVPRARTRSSSVPPRSQTGGRERFLAARVLVDATDLPVFDGPDVREFHFDGNAAAGAVPGEAHPDEGAVARCADLDGLDLQVGVGLDPPCVLFLDCFDPLMRP